MRCTWLCSLKPGCDNNILHVPHHVVPVLDLGDVTTARVILHTFIAQQVVGNNVYEFIKGGSSCEV
jgi:hypothetical protein